MPDSALIVVDMQNDFLPGGSLAVPGGHDIIPTLNQYIARFVAAGCPIIATRDWHPPETTHFQAGGGVWPAHCVRDTPGAAIHPDLELPESTVIISKGTGATEDAYSGFQGRDEHGVPLTKVLRTLGVHHLYIGGVATDYCTSATALAGLSEGFRVTVLLDTVRGINLNPGGIENAIDAMVRAGAELATIERLEIEGVSAARP